MSRIQRNGDGVNQAKSGAVRWQFGWPESLGDKDTAQSPEYGDTNFREPEHKVSISKKSRG